MGGVLHSEPASPTTRILPVPEYDDVAASHLLFNHCEVAATRAADLPIS